MVSAPEVRVWAESLLEPLKSDRRDLPRTLRAWLENDTQVERTAAALNLSPVTVRGHLRAAAPLIHRDLVADGDGQEVLEEGEQVLGGVRALAFALHVSTGRPACRAPGSREPRGRRARPRPRSHLCTGARPRVPRCAPAPARTPAPCTDAARPGPVVHA